MQRRQAISALALLAGAAPAYAQSYPSRPVKIIVPAPPGGTADIFARALGQRMQAAMGQPFVVEYKPGAATNIGTDFVAKSAPDGYTLLFNGITLASNPALFAKLPFNPATDLAPIIEVASMVNVITVHPSVPAQTLRELVQMARNAPGTINHGSPGIGSSGHLAGELLAHRTGIKLTHVPYQGLAPATNDHVAGILGVGFVTLPVPLQLVKAGKIRALAVTAMIGVRWRCGCACSRVRITSVAFRPSMSGICQSMKMTSKLSGLSGRRLCSKSAAASAPVAAVEDDTPNSLSISTSTRASRITRKTTGA
jgi:tripartite-type tricarboxylate transporter receptor subunit TctC